jgi:hypothetical protein
MFKIKDYFGHIILISILSIWLIGLIYTFEKGYKTEPLIHSIIPQEIIDFFNDLPKFINIGPIFNPDPDIADWGKYESIDDMHKLEDTCFMIFYSSLDSVSERANAERTLKYANKAIPALEDFMQTYPYPYKVNNRKLPIYLAKTEKNYEQIQKELGITPIENSIGVYIYEFSSLGSRAIGIVLSPKSWIDNSNKKTLWHEMNHFVYFTNFDYANNTAPYLWFTEGCAEYFSNNTARNNSIDIDMAEKFDFTNNTRGNEVYWIGYTAFVYYEKTYGSSLLSDLVWLSYDYDLNTALSKSSGISLSDWQKGWKNYIKDFINAIASHKDNTKEMFQYYQTNQLKNGIMGGKGM